MVVVPPFAAAKRDELDPRAVAAVVTGRIGAPETCPSELTTYVPENAPVHGSTNHTVSDEPLVFTHVENGAMRLN